MPDEYNIDSVASTDLGPDQLAQNADMSDRLRIEIDDLPVHYRTILTLYHLEDMTYGEIAEVTGLPEGTVKSHLFRGRKLLKEKLLQKYRAEDLWTAVT
jgi:RNA polymerase sigma-70 factor (ECF subfamily)